jgi:hypothetical protein
MPSQRRSLVMAKLGFALYEAHQRRMSAEQIASRLERPTEWVRERIEAARLCLVVARKR